MTIQATLDEPFLTVLGHVRSAAVSLGWMLVSGGQPEAPTVPMFFRHGFGSFRPADGLQVQLRELDANRTLVNVTVWRGTVVVDGYEADRLLRALGTHPV